MCVSLISLVCPTRSPISSLYLLVVLSTVESGVLTSPSSIVELSISPFNSVSFCFVCFNSRSLDT